MPLQKELEGPLMSFSVSSNQIKGTFEGVCGGVFSFLREHEKPVFRHPTE